MPDEGQIKLNPPGAYGGPSFFVLLLSFTKFLYCNSFLLLLAAPFEAFPASFSLSIAFPGYTAAYELQAQY